MLCACKTNTHSNKIIQNKYELNIKFVLAYGNPNISSWMNICWCSATVKFSRKCIRKEMAYLQTIFELTKTTTTTIEFAMEVFAFSNKIKWNFCETCEQKRKWKAFLNSYAWHNAFPLLYFASYNFSFSLFLFSQCFWQFKNCCFFFKIL